MSLTSKIVPGKQQQPLLLVQQGLGLTLLLWRLGTRHQLGSLLEGSVSCSDIPQHQLNVAHHRPDSSIISPFSQQPAEPL